jgi:type I restriction enzyme M protein
LDNNSILNIQAREVILQYFDIIAITELGTNTFMATDIKTIVFSLRRKNNADFVNIKASVDRFFQNFQDITINGIEKPVKEYVSYTWGDIAFKDFITLLKKKPNTEILEHDIYKEYLEKLTGSQEEKLDKIIAIEKEKIVYFIVALPQRLVYVKTGEKSDEKQFLGYEFSNRRGNEGIHPIKKGSPIDECTSLYDSNNPENIEKANYYIAQGFKGKTDLAIPDSLNKNVEYLNLIDLLDFTEVDFDKKIKKITKTNIKYEELWGTNNLTTIVSIADVKKGKSITKAQTVEGTIPVIAGGQTPAYFHNQSNRDGNIITVSASGAYAGYLNYFDTPIFASDCNTIKSRDEKLMPTRLLFLNFINYREDKPNLMCTAMTLRRSKFLYLPTVK